MKHTEETKHKLSEMRQGKKNPMYGRKHTPEALKKIGASTRKHNLQRQYDLDPMTIPKLNDHDLGYLAGIVDGEGTIGFRKERPHIAVYGSSRELMEWLQEKVGGNIIWGADKRGRVLGHVWGLSAAKNLYHLCRQLWPSLVIKQWEAGDVMRFLKEKYGDRING